MFPVDELFSLYRIRRCLILQTQIIIAHLHSVFMTTRKDIFLLLHTFINRTAISLLNVILFIQTQQFIIHMIYNLWKRSHSFIHVRTAHKVKVNVDALDDFIQNLLVCLLCTIHLKTTWSVNAICCLCRTFIATQNDKLIYKLQA